MQAYNAINRLDIICLSETYLDNSYHTDDDQLTFPGYNLIRADNPNNIKRGGVCIYHRDSLPVKVINLNILNECLVCELSFGSHRVCLVSVYRTPSQSNNEYDTFLLNFEQLTTYLNSIKPHVLLVTGDFNVRSSSWWSDDIDTVEGTRLESITSYYGLHQIINEPTHILPSSASCIDLIFTNQPNLVIDSGVHLSLHQNCHHQIIFAKINLKVYYPPPYKRLVWDYKKVNIDAINLAIKSFDCENAFNGKGINSQLKLFNETLLNIFSNFIPNKIQSFRDSDPTWINDDIKSKIKLKHKLYHRYLRHKRNKEDFA